MKKLTAEQEKLIKGYVDRFKKSKPFKEELKSREQHRELAVKILKQSRLKKMTEIEFGELISNLWASLIWGNKDYLVKKIIDDNGIDKIKSQFINLLYGKTSFEKRFNKFIKEIKGLGHASITEILCLFDPKKFGIWNDRARKGLKILKFDNLPLNKYQISGEGYMYVNKALMLMGKRLKNLKLSSFDLLAVDYFLWEIWLVEKKKIDHRGEEKAKKADFDHNEVRDFIKEVGDNLGFEAEVEKTVATGARVDVIWRANIANLGVVTYIFEIHKSGNIDGLILNLQKALNNPTVQKIIAVSDEEQLEKIKGETRGLPENFRKALAFWEVSDVINTHEKLSEVIESINKLELVKSQFEE